MPTSLATWRDLATVEFSTDVSDLPHAPHWAVVAGEALVNLVGVVVVFPADPAAVGRGIGVEFVAGVAQGVGALQLRLD
jgi:hypothetical protein